jgi:hypothetical protein
MGVIKDGQCCGKCESYAQSEDGYDGECHYCIEWPPIPVAITIKQTRRIMHHKEGYNCYCFEEKED